MQVKKIVITVILFSSFCEVWSQENSYTISFSVNNMGIATHGTIGDVKAKIIFNTEQLHESSIHATASAATITSGIALRDKHLKRPDYFHTDKYPVIVLQSTSFRRIRKNVYEGGFNLTIKNVTRSVLISITVKEGEKSIVYRGIFEINRLDFHLGEASTVLDEKVKITLEATEYFADSH